MMDHKDYTNPKYHGAFLYNERIDEIFKSLNRTHLIIAQGGNWRENYKAISNELKALFNELSPMMDKELLGKLLEQWTKNHNMIENMASSKTLTRSNSAPITVVRPFMEFEIELRRVHHDKGLLLKYEDKQGSAAFK